MCLFQLATSPLCILMRRRFPLVDIINFNILRLQESGIIDQILTDVNRNNLKFEVPKKIENKPQDKLTLKDVEMIGFLLICGHSIAFIIFLVELIVWNIKRRLLQLEFIN